MSSINDCDIRNTVVGSINACTRVVEYSYYGYNVTKWVAILFTVLFAITAILHLVQAVRYRLWFLLITVFLCSFGETIGWAGRIWSSESAKWDPAFGGYWDSNRSAFMQQIASLIITPAFLAAGWYIMLKRIISVLGPRYTSVEPKFYAFVFVGGDIVSLVVQAAGGASAAGAETSEEANRGANIMVAGVFIQMLIMILYSITLADFVRRWLQDRPAPRVIGIKRWKTKALAAHTGPVDSREERKAKFLVGAIVFSTLVVFVRSIYRCIELLAGWDSELNTNETLFTILDALMVFLGLAVFNFIHPGKYLPRSYSHTDLPMEKRGELDGSKGELAA